ncbi:MAG: phosphoadenylyl-sulfate reductase [Mariprofundaceae bacterium]|nr:phosphoadenylyl-sulfate reductase [Mariprofundaceae bacterium]
MHAKLQHSKDLLQKIESDYAPNLVFACSFGAEDVVLVDLISRYAPKINIITLDTGRLHQQTYDVMDACRQKYGIEIKVCFPDTQEVESMLTTHGANLFYSSIENRKMCCAVRKVHVLKKVLKNQQAWVTGVRRDQASSRQEMQEIEDDQAFGIKKANPLLAWSEKNIWQYIEENDVPCNALHAQGFPSIGCEPCTRAITVGEDPRSGRWWWEQEDAVAECGLHASPLNMNK